MRQTHLFTKTRKEAPADEVAKNAQLLIRAGYIGKEMAGVYSYLPLGLRVVEKIKQIVREEMNSLGGQELLMTTLQPKELWEKTDRWSDENNHHAYRYSENSNVSRNTWSYTLPIVILLPILNSSFSFYMDTALFLGKWRGNLACRN